MKNKYIEQIFYKYSDRYLSQWIILIYDLAVVLITFVIANFMRYDFENRQLDVVLIVRQSFSIFLVFLFAFLLTKSYRGIIRHSGINDSLRILKATGTACLSLICLNLILKYSTFSGFVPSLSVIIITFLLAHLVLVWSRFLIKSFYFDFITKDSRKSVKVLIYGAGSAGMHARMALKGDSYYRHEIMAFIDDNESKVSKMLEGVPVISAEKGLSQRFVQQNDISLLIIAIMGIEILHKNEITEKALELGLKVKVVPSINKWINGQLSSSQIHDVKIEELLGREPISLENEKITQQIRNKRVLVTGAAGSIGSEIVRQLIQYCPSRIILVDQAESELYNLQQEIFALNQHFGNHTSLVFLIASIKDRFRMNSIFNLYNPDFVYHAAAYKHVPLMEENPYEALMVNVFGTKIIADLALKYQCQRFVMVSTDKAVNPTNVMGASKRIAEMYIQCMSNERTHFITTRFGNVLGSNGSVIPLFKKQIESGGPVTVTHKDITRYFMTIPEACNLVLEASVMGKGGEILIFDMGSSIKIYDLARKMVQLSGLVPGKDIQITEVGLRPGEKLAEELLANEEYTLPTHHPKIMKARVKENGRKEILRCIEELSQIVLEGDNFALVDKMKEIIPEYISNNSIYTKLDARKHKK